MRAVLAVLLGCLLLFSACSPAGGAAEISADPAAGTAQTTQSAPPVTAVTETIAVTEKTPALPLQGSGVLSESDALALFAEKFPSRAVAQTVETELFIIFFHRRAETEGEAPFDLFDIDAVLKNTGKFLPKSAELQWFTDMGSGLPLRGYCPLSRVSPASLALFLDNAPYGFPGVVRLNVAGELSLTYDGGLFDPRFLPLSMDFFAAGLPHDMAPPGIELIEVRVSFGELFFAFGAYPGADTKTNDGRLLVPATRFSYDKDNHTLELLFENAVFALADDVKNLQNEFVRSASIEARPEGLAVVLRLTAAADRYLPYMGTVFHEKAAALGFVSAGQMILRFSDPDNTMLWPQTGEPLALHPLND